jgi:ATP-dependent DNA helicase RecG
LSSIDEQILELNQGIAHIDEEPVANSSVSDLNKTLVNGYIENRKLYSDVLSEMDNDAILLRTGVLHHTGNVTVAGLLALGIYPQQHFPNYAIKASVRKDQALYANAWAYNVAAFDGPIPAMLRSALRWVMNNSKEYTLDLRDGNVGRVGEYPVVTIREMIANALIHRLCQAIHNRCYAKINIMQSKAA